MTSLAPRQGYYFILKQSKLVLAGIECPIAIALWKQNESDSFDLDFHVTIQLKSLEGEYSKGPKHKLTGYLLKSIIHVMKAEVITVDDQKA